MDAPGPGLKQIDDAMARATSPLARGLKALAEANAGCGTCLLVAHEEFGEVLIADRHWRRGRDETLRESARLALVDLHQESGFHRVAVLVEPSGGAGRLDDGALELTLAALEVTSALAAMAAPVAVPRDGVRMPLPAPVPLAALPGRATGDDGRWGI